MSINSEKEPNIRGEVVQLRRIADALEEVIRMVKLDQEAAKKRWEYKPEEKDSEQTTRITNGPGLPGPCALARGSRTELQATSGKLQAPSCKLDKTEL